MKVGCLGLIELTPQDEQMYVQAAAICEATHAAGPEPAAFREAVDELRSSNPDFFESSQGEKGED